MCSQWKNFLHLHIPWFSHNVKHKNIQHERGSRKINRQRLGRTWMTAASSVCDRTTSLGNSQRLWSPTHGRPKIKPMNFSGWRLMRLHTSLKNSIDTLWFLRDRKWVFFKSVIQWTVPHPEVDKQHKLDLTDYFQRKKKKTQSWEGLGRSRMHLGGFGGEGRGAKNDQNILQGILHHIKWKTKISNRILVIWWVAESAEHTCWRALPGNWEQLVISGQSNTCQFRRCILMRCLDGCLTY